MKKHTECLKSRHGVGPLLLLLIFLLSGCNISFFFNNDEYGIQGATQLDKSLILRQQRERILHKAGKLKADAAFCQVNTVKYVLREENNALYLIFFGTDNPLDMYYNLINWQEPFWTKTHPGIKVHAGFFRPYAAAAPAIRQKVRQYLKRHSAKPRMYIAGHSTGGAHAVLAAFDLYTRFITEFPALDNAVYCQIGGTPAVGNAVFAREFNSRIQCHRYVNGSDMMPSMLTREMGFIPVGTGYRIGPPKEALTASSGLWLSQHFIHAYAVSVRRIPGSSLR